MLDKLIITKILCAGLNLDLLLGPKCEKLYLLYSPTTLCFPLYSLITYITKVVSVFMTKWYHNLYK